MERVRRVRIRIWLCVIIASHLRAIAAQRNGWVSIDCGATSDYTDTAGIEWTTDEAYISAGQNGRSGGNLGSPVNEDQLASVRHFPERRSKFCYGLPASEGLPHLVRASFLHGGYKPAEATEFDVAVDGTRVDTLTWTADDPNVIEWVEYVVRTSSKRIDFCLVPGTGEPFINALELRPLGETMYNVSGAHLKMVFRRSYGLPTSVPPIRFPADTFDRIWTHREFEGLTSLTTTQPVTVDDVRNLPPEEALQGAVSGRSFYVTFNLGAYEYRRSSMVYYILYMADIDDDGLAPIMDFRLNGRLVYSDLEVTSAFDGYSLKNDGLDLTTQILNFTISATNDSAADAVLNAAEIYAFRSLTAVRTSPEDADALEAVKDSLGLTSWGGDPCLPVPFDWIECSSDDIAQITSIDLSNFELSGTISPRISELTALTDLDLADNNIRGGIPDLRGLSKLKTLLLQNNSLSGAISGSLALLPALIELDLSNNQLSGPIPAALESKEGLTLRTGGNPKLCGSAETCDTSPVEPSKTDGGGGGGGGLGIGAIIGIIAGCVVAALAVFCAIGCYYRRKKSRTDSEVLPVVHPAPAPELSPESNVDGLGVKQIRRFTFAELHDATSGFAEGSRRGEGGYGRVYHGKLSNGTEMAVKRSSDSSKRTSKQFETEVVVLSRVHHRNLVTFLGFCDEDGEQILVYEYMTLGTLREHLYGKDLQWCLAWTQRLEVALSVAQALQYLHDSVSQRIIHRDVKSNNILLHCQAQGSRLVAKLADFGTSKITRDGETEGAFTSPMGTNGYMDPEYEKSFKVTHKSDVYSFGVVLLELITAKPPRTMNPSTNTVFILTDWAKEQLQKGDLDSIVDQNIQGDPNAQSLWKTADVAFWCLQPQGANRPEFSEVTRELKTALDYELLGAGEAGGGAQLFRAVRPPTASVSATQSSSFSVPEYPSSAEFSSEPPRAAAAARPPAMTRNTGPTWISPQPR